MHVTIPRKFRHIIWENKIEQRKRFINATEKLGKIEELALHLIFFIQIRQLKEKAFPLVMRDVFLLPWLECASSNGMTELYKPGTSLFWNFGGSEMLITLFLSIHRHRYLYHRHFQHQFNCQKLESKWRNRSQLRRVLFFDSQELPRIWKWQAVDARLPCLGCGVYLFPMTKMHEDIIPKKVWQLL